MASLCKLDYPIYACKALDGSRIVVGGGGGASKTGVPNVVDLLELQEGKKTPICSPIERLETGNTAVMNMSVLNQGPDKPFLLAVGLGGTCKIYSVVKKTKPAHQKKDGVRSRKKKTVEIDNTDGDSTDGYSFNLLKTLETDFSDDEPLQKAVQISRDGSIIVTGGSDGSVRSWNMSDFSKRFKSKGHHDDVTDVDISPDSKHVVSVSRDGTASIWNAENGFKEIDLHALWNAHMVSRDYRFRSCRYGTIVEDPKKYALFTAHCPVRPGRKADNKAPQGCLTKWARKKSDNDDGPLKPTIVQYTGREAISSMCISGDGVFIGLGFMEGSISLYISFSLQCAKRVQNVHSIFVTGLSFIPLESENAIIGPCDAALVSVSADSQCKMTKLSSRTFFPMWVGLLIIFIGLAAAAYLLYEFKII